MRPIIVIFLFVNLEFVQDRTSFSDPDLSCLLSANFIIRSFLKTPSIAQFIHNPVLALTANSELEGQGATNFPKN